MFAAGPTAKGFGAFHGKSTSPQQQQRKKQKAPSSSSSQLPPSPQQILKTLEKTYGGTTPMEIARGTEKSIQRTLQSQSVPVQRALQLYRQLVLATATSAAPLDGAQQQVSEELGTLLQLHNITERDLHNLLQQATWDASAYAKAARALMGEMPIDTQRKVQKGCDLLVEYASKAAAVMVDDEVIKIEIEDDMENNQSDEIVHHRPTILDVGCGFGVLVPFLKKAGLKSNQIHGIDLSPEMIRHAQETMRFQYDDDEPSSSSQFLPTSPTFTAGDFLTYQPPSQWNNKKKHECFYEGLIFCSSLHDMPNMIEDTLPKAQELLTPNGGVLVIMHPQGAPHVLNQVKTNPTMVPRGLPTKSELQALKGWDLIHAPAMARSMQEAREGYLAVLVRTQPRTE